MKCISFLAIGFACVATVGALDLSDLMVREPVNPDDVMLRRPAGRTRAELDARAKAAAAAAAEAQAKADAEAKIVAAEAEAKSNDLLEKSLTDKILYQMYIEKWDGRLPSTIAGDSANILIPVTDPSSSESSQTSQTSQTSQPAAG